MEFNFKLDEYSAFGFIFFLYILNYIRFFHYCSYLFKIEFMLWILLSNCA